MGGDLARHWTYSIRLINCCNMQANAAQGGKVGLQRHAFMGDAFNPVIALVDRGGSIPTGDDEYYQDQLLVTNNRRSVG